MQLMLLFSVHVFFSRGGGDLVINLDQIIYAGFFYYIVFKKISVSVLLLFII